MPSFLNGLSQLGAGVASFAGNAGLEVQKAQLANQQAILADQLATTRETTLQGQSQAFQTGLEGQRQQFQAGQTDKTLAAEQARQAAELAERSSEGAANRAAELAQTNLTVNAPSDTIKLLKFLGVDPSSPQGQSLGGGSGGTTTGATPLPGPRTTGGVAADGSVVPPSSGAAAATSPGANTSPSANPMASNLINKVLGLPEPGSEAANRFAIAQDVSADPSFKYASTGQKAAEVERRVAVATAKIASPADQDAMADAIANYKLSPLDARARMMAGGPDTMGKVLAKNPNFNETNYDAIKETQKAIAPGGTLAVPISAMNTSMGHADHFLDIAQQLGNYSGGNWANIIPNKLASNTGNAPLVNALNQTAFAMAEEGNKIYAGNAGTESAINNWYKSFPVNGSLADQVAAVKNFAQLMGDKFDTMQSMVNKTFTDSGLPPVQLLTPKARTTYDRLVSMGPDGKPQTGAQSAGTPSYDEFGNVSVKPAASAPAIKPPAIGEVQQGYSFTGGNPADPKSWKPVQ